MPTRRTFRRIGALALALPAPLYAFAPGCSADQPADPSYLRIDVFAAPGASAALVDVTSAGGTLPSVCLKLDPTGQTATSFVLKRDPTTDATARIVVKVTGFAMLSGSANFPPGSEFTCPQPPSKQALAPVQEVSVAFCASQSQSLVVHAGATCCVKPDAGAPDAGDAGKTDAGKGDAGDGGKPDGGAPVCGCPSAADVCGAGVSTEGHACRVDDCCPKLISDACALDPAK